MFNPNQRDVRHFFCETYRKTVAREVLTPLESIASEWIIQHREYAPDLTDLNAACEKEYSVEAGKANPFLHLSMHLTIAEQISINQPIGIAAAFNALAQHLQSEHEAHHVIMECLASMLWEMQCNQSPFDGATYIAAIEGELRRIKNRSY